MHAADPPAPGQQQSNDKKYDGFLHFSAPFLGLFGNKYVVYTVLSTYNSIIAYNLCTVNPKKRIFLEYMFGLPFKIDLEVN